MGEGIAVSAAGDRGGLVRMLQAEEVAEILSVSKARVYALARDGVIPVIYLGRQIRIDPRILEDFLTHGGRSLPGGSRRTASPE